MNLHAEADLGPRLGRRTLGAREESDRPGTWTLEAVEGPPGLRATILLWLDDAAELGRQWQVQSDCDALTSGAARERDPLRLQLTFPAHPDGPLLLMLQGLPGPVTVLLPLTVVEERPSEAAQEADAVEPAEEVAAEAPPAPEAETGADDPGAHEAEDAVDWARLRAPEAPGGVDWVRPIRDLQHEAAERTSVDAVGPSAPTDAMRAGSPVAVEAAPTVTRHRAGPPWPLWLLVGAIGAVALLVALKPSVRSAVLPGGGAAPHPMALTESREQAIEAFSAEEWLGRRDAYPESGKPEWVAPEGYGSGAVTLEGRTPSDMTWNKEDGIITRPMHLDGPMAVSVSTALPTGTDSCSVGIALLGAVVDETDPLRRPARFASELQHDATGRFATSAVVKLWDFSRYPDSSIRDKIEAQATRENQAEKNHAAYWPTSDTAVAWWLVSEAFGGEKLSIGSGSHDVRLRYDPGSQMVEGFVDGRELGGILVQLGPEVRVTIYMSTGERGVRMRARFSRLEIDHDGAR